MAHKVALKKVEQEQTESIEKPMASGSKKKLYVLGAAFTAFLMIGVAIGAITFATTPSGFPTVIEPGSMVSGADYVVFKDGGNYYAKDGATGAIDISGADATTVIHSAFGALTAGRTWKEKVVLKGSLTVESTIIIPSYTTIEIQGLLTLADGVHATMIVNSEGAGADAYTDPGDRNTNIEIYGGMIDGNKVNQGVGSDNIDCISIQGCDNVIIRDLTLINGFTEGIRTAFCNNVLITGCIINNSADDNIAINKLTVNATVSNNICLNAGLTVAYGAPCGIEIQDGSANVVVEGNFIYNANDTGIKVCTHTAQPPCYSITIIGNHIYNSVTTGIIVSADSDLSPAHYINVIGNVIDTTTGTTGYGITITKSMDCQVEGNIVRHAYRSGIYVNDVTCDVSITNNLVVESGLSGIWLNVNSLSCKVSGNTVANNGHRVVGSQIGIQVHGDSHYIVGNFCYDNRTGASRTQQYGIYLYAGASFNNVSNNYLYNNVNGPLGNAGDNNTIRYNVGYVTENSGIATITGAASTVTVNHLLSTTPTIVLVTGNSTLIGNATVTSISSTQFVISFENQPGTNAWAFYWYAKV